MTFPKVSVIMPVYNGSRFLRQAIESVLSQTMQDLELICVNDGSTDDSCKIMKEFRQAYWNRLGYSVYALSKILRECYQYSFPRRVFIMFSYILRRKGKD